jgi:hypothetical protein
VPLGVTGDEWQESLVTSDTLQLLASQHELVLIGNRISPDRTIPANPQFWERRQPYVGWAKWNPYDLAPVRPR